MKLLLVILLSGCTPYFSAAVIVHPTGVDEPEVTLENPIAEFEIGLKKDSLSVFIRHGSGIFDTESGYGFNTIGVRYTLE